MNRYNNYHKHSHYSSIFTPDSNSHAIDYVNRALELGEKNVFTTEHGSMGDIFETRSLCDKNNLKCIAGLEGYIVPNPLEKDSNNYHIVLIPKTDNARKKLNKANSRANREGYYYKPRLFLEDLLAFNSNELFITTACCAGILRDENSIKNIFYPLYEHFGKNLMLEVQNHNQNIQKIINEKAIKYHNELGLYLIAANDSHYIYPYQSAERAELLKGKGINYDDEDSFMLDYPDYETMAERFTKQGIFTKSQIIDAIDQTLIFDECEDIKIDKSIKMPTIYPNYSDNEKIEELRRILNIEFPKVMKQDNIPKDKQKIYVEEVNKELEVIKNTSEVHTADYFLFNYANKNLAINKYGGVLTRSGRGSCGAFLTNKILGITQIDRLSVDLPIYSERFMSTARILENHALPDIDFNVATQEPFVLASKELLGENGCYPMVAYGTMQISEAFRNICRSKELPYEIVNEVAKNLDNYKNDSDWKPIIEEAEKYVDTIVSASVHPCAHILLNNDIESEIGVIKIGDYLCAMITSNEADEWKYLKNDYLIVTVWDIIDKTFKLINKPIIPIKELLDNIDNRVWKLFEDGMTATLNQCDGDWATSMLKVYKPKSLEELSKFVGAIRPSYEAFRDDFIHRRKMSTGSKELDNLFSQTDQSVIFQECLMKYFEWLYVTPAESVGLIKKISKKKIKPQDFTSLENRLRDGWIKNVGNDNQFDEMWQKMQSMMYYGFNSPHGVATAIDCLYCAYLKVNYPLEYYTVVLNTYSNNEEKTNRLIDEIKYFNIKLSPPVFRHSISDYTYDKNTNIIYRGIRSIKNIGKNNGAELYELRNNQYNSFFELLEDITQNTTVNKSQLDILIKLNFFKEFGNINQLLYAVELYNKYGKCKTIKKDKLSKEETLVICKYAEKETEKQFTKLDNISIIKGFYNNNNINTSVYNIVSYQAQLLGYCDIIIERDNCCVVLNVETNKWGTTYCDLYCLGNGHTKTIKVNKKYLSEIPLEIGDVIKTSFDTKAKKIKDNNGKWKDSGEYELILKAWSKQNT